MLAITQKGRSDARSSRPDSDNREFYREFLKNPPPARFFKQNSPAISIQCGQIPYAQEQGIFARRTGIFLPVTGNNREFPRMPFDVRPALQTPPAPQ
jgi:hypothetical protein